MEPFTWSALVGAVVPIPTLPPLITNWLVPAINPLLSRFNGPDMVSPALSTLLEAEPVRLAVMVPAEKFPLASLATMAAKVLALVAVVLAFGRIPVIAVLRGMFVIVFEAPDIVLLVKVSVLASVAKVPVVVGKVKVAAPETRFVAMFPESVLPVNVSVPAKVARVPAVGRVMEVVPVAVRVVLKAPDVVRLPPRVIVFAPLLMPVPP